MFRGNLSCLSLCPLPGSLPLGTTEKSLVSSSLHPPFRYLYTLVTSLSLLQAEQFQLSKPLFTEEIASPFIILVALHN